MSKSYSYYVTSNLRLKLDQAVREKKHIVNLLLEVVGILISDVKPSNKGFGEFVIQIDKMSRVFFSLSNGDGHELKIFSFNFPYAIRENEEGLDVVCVPEQIEVNNAYLSALKSLAVDGIFDEKNNGILSPLDFAEIFERNIRILGLEEIKVEEEILSLVRKLTLFEPGYIRYDFDVERADPLMHPLHHLDIHYSSNATFKLGFPSSLEISSFIDILDIRTACYHIKD